MIIDIISGLVVCLILACSWGVNNYVIPNTQVVRSEQEFNATLARARTSAQERTNGLTVTIVPRGGGSEVAVVDGRPEPGSTAGPGMGNSASLPVTLTVNGSPNAALLVDTSGRFTVAAPWSPWTTMASEPAECSTATVVLARGTVTSTFTLSCADGSLQ